MPLDVTFITTAGLVECSQVVASHSHYPRHTHDEYVLSANISGYEQIEFDGKTRDVCADQLTIYNPLTVQSSRFLAEPTHFFSVHLPVDSLKQVLDGSGMLGGQQAPALQEGVMTNGRLSAAIMALCTAAEPMQEEALLMLVSELVPYCASPVVDEVESGRVGWVLEYMKENVEKALSLDLLSEVACTTKFHLIRSFKRSKNMSPMQYFQQLRLIEAKKRLKLGASPIQVAQELGFYDQSHFGNVFRKVMGITPSRYSKAFKS